MNIKHLLLLLTLTTLLSCTKNETDESLTIFNAASTTDLMTEAVHLYKKKTGVTIHLNPASSGTLAKQISQGADADIYISANKKWADFLYDKDYTAPLSAFAQNTLVLIAPRDTEIPPLEINRGVDFPGMFEGRLSMGDPDHVPAGRYAQEALTYYGWYDSLKERILPASDVRAALAVIELGECNMGIVYSTDAMKSGKVAVLGTFPEESHSPVTYFAAAVKGKEKKTEDFLDFFYHDKAVKTLLIKYGFIPIEL